MLTTPDDPHQSLPSLRQRNPKNSNVLSGHYRINGSIITAVLKREYVSESSQITRKHKSNKSRDKAFSSQTFHISLEVRTVKKKRNIQLIWSYYSVHYKRPNGQESVTSFELTPNLFPPFWFSRVKSYVSEAEYRLT
jgi:F-box protein 9